MVRAFLRAGLGLAVVALSCALPQVAAAGRWTKPEAVSRDRVANEAEVDVAAGSHQYAVAIWRTGRDLPVPEAARRSAGRRVVASVRGLNARRFGHPRPLSGRGATSPRLAMSPAGETFVSWNDNRGRVNVVSRTPGTDWGSPHVLSGPERSAHSLAVGSDGTAIVTWMAPSQAGTPVEASIRPAGGEFTSPVTVAEGVELESVPLAAAGNGHGAVVMETSCQVDPEQSPQAAAVLAPGGSFGEPEPIPGSGCSTAGLGVAMDDIGTAIVLVDGLPSAFGRSNIRASVRPPDGSFIAAEPISGKRDSNFATLGMAPSGRAIAIWSAFKGSRATSVLGAVREPGGSFGTPSLLLRRPGALNDLAVGSQGQALTTWATRRHGVRRLEAAFMRSGGWFGRRERVFAPLPEDAATDPHAAVSPEGDALVAWTRPDLSQGGGRGVFIARRAPSCRGIEATIVGTAADDQLAGTPRRDVILARGGDDVIVGSAGDDLICGGSGADLIRGGGGDDRIIGGRGHDSVWAAGGEDLLLGGRGRDRLAGGVGSDRLRGGRGADGLNGDAGDDDSCRGGRPRKDIGRILRTADVADRVGCERIRGARPGRIDLGSGPVSSEVE
jgi:hypothetical protein